VIILSNLQTSEKKSSVCDDKIYQEKTAKMNLLKIYSLCLQATILEWKCTTKLVPITQIKFEKQTCNLQ